MSFADDVVNGNYSSNKSYGNKKKKRSFADQVVMGEIDDNLSSVLFPVKQTQAPVQQPEQKKQGFFDNWVKFDAFNDGYQMGDITNTILGTGANIRENFEKGVTSNVEGVIDFGANLISGAAEGIGQKDAAKSIREWAQKDFISEQQNKGLNKVLRKFTQRDALNIIDTANTINQAIVTGDLNILNPFNKEASEKSKKLTQESTVLDTKGEGVVQGVGQLAGQAMLNAAGVPWQLTAFANSAGSEMNNAFSNNANFGQALISGIISGAVEVGSEYIGGGANKLLGMTSLGSKAIEKLGGKISNKFAARLLKIGIDAASEGFEEVVSGFGQAVGQKLTYMSDKELKELYSSDQALEEFISGAIVSAIGNAPGNIQSIQRGEQAFTGRTQNEQRVYDALLQERIDAAQEGGKKLTKKQINQIETNLESDLQKGRIGSNNIERVLGYGDRVNNLIIQTEQQLGRELNQQERQQIQQEVSQEYFNELGKDELLQRSYYEDAQSTQKLDIDVSQYKGKQQEIVQKAIDSGLLNNTTATKELVDFVSKMAADKGISFDWTNNENLKNSGFAVDGANINGYVNAKGDITLNIDASKPINSIVGHEITHVLEGSELYDSLAKAVKDYATSIGEYDERLKKIEKLYEDVESADSVKELTADLVGDYLFTNQEFINQLTKDRNLFEKIFDEIKYMLKQATTGSKEERELNKAKKMFEKAYRDNSVKLAEQENTTSNPNIRYSLTTDSNGRELTKQQQEYFKDSKNRTPDGSLRVMYRGGNEDFNIFDRTKANPNGQQGNGFYFTTSKDHAMQYGTPKEYYLNIVNPLEYKFNSKPKTITKEQLHNLVESMYNNEDYSMENYGSDATIDSITNDIYSKDTDYDMLMDLNMTAVGNMADFVEYVNNVIGTNYDGIITDYETVVFNSNQIKNVDNTNPTNNPDIRYSLTQKADSVLDDLTDEQYEYFKNTKAVDNDGELEVVYHGSPNQFSIFDISKSRNNQYMDGFYFTNAKSTARAYTDSPDGMYSIEDDGVYEGYVNIEHPIDSKNKSITFNQLKEIYNRLQENPNYQDEDMEGWTYFDDVLSNYGDVNQMGVDKLLKTFYDSFDNDEVLVENMLSRHHKDIMYSTLRDVTGIDGQIVNNPNGWDDFEKYYIAFNPDQFKLKSNKTPTNNVDINLSLTRTGENIAPIGDYNVYGRDIALQDEIAPAEINYEDAQIKNNQADILDLIRLQQERKEGNIKASTPVIAKEKSTLRTGLDTLKTMFVNKNAEIDNLARESGNKNIKFAGDMLNNYAAEAQNDIEIAQTNNEGKQIGKSVNQLFEPAQSKGLLAAFNDYLINYSNIDRWARGKGSATPLDVSEKLVKSYEQEHPEFVKWAADVWKYSENVRKNWLDAGMITKNMYDTLSEAYPHYVPYISDGTNKNFDSTLDKLNELKTKAFKSAKGGATQLYPVQEALTKYTYANKRAYRTNELYKQIYNTLQTNEGQRGSEVGEGYFESGQNLYRDDSGNFLTAVIDGEERSVQISDDLFKSLRNDMETQIKDYENRLSLITKPLQTIGNLRRNILTSWSPTFTITNPLKDIQDAFMNSKHPVKLAKNYMGAVKELFTNSTDEVKQFKALYGGANTMGQYDVDSGLYKPKTGNKNNNFLKKLMQVNEIMELAPRYAEFKSSLQSGDSYQEAMYNAREVTTNFSRGGVITKALNRNGFTFLNANVQGFDKFIRNFSGENGARGIVNSLLKATLLGVVPALFNELVFGMGDDKDEDYAALPDYIKDNYYLIKTGDGNFVRIPKGRMLSVFGSAARRTLELAEGEEDAFEGFLSNANSQVGISNPEESNIFAPLIQAFGSKNGRNWYGGDLVPTRLQDKPEAEQYDASIDKFSIWLGEKTGISPYKINYVLDQYSGGVGDLVLPTITDEATSNGSLLAPVVDKFTADSTTDNKYVSDFYTKNDEFKVQANSSEATDDDMLRNQYMYGISKDMSKLYAERRAIQSDNSLSKAEKYAKSQAIKDQINQLAKAGLDGYKDIQRTGSYATVGEDMGYYKNAKGNWTAIDQDDIIATESIGLNDLEKSKYYETSNDVYNINQKYKSKLANANETQKTVLNSMKKKDIINAIKGSGLPDDGKALLYDKSYASTDTVNAVINAGINFDSYLDLEAQGFTADKDKDGKTINGSKKAKVYNYINQMPMSYEKKIMLAKLYYKSDDTYNREIINYLNNDSSISYDEMKQILKAMGMKIDDYGHITW